MNYEEAVGWLNGKRSMCNSFDYASDSGLAHKLCSEADAAMTQQAYWIVKAHVEGLIK